MNALSTAEETKHESPAALLAEHREELARLEAGGVVPQWTNREQAIADAKKWIAGYENWIAENGNNW